MGTRIEPYWLEENDWLVCLEFLPEDDPEDRARGTEAIGYFYGYSQKTNSRMLALVADRIGHAFELLFSFPSPDAKREFLELVRSNELTNRDDGPGFSVPSFEEIRDAQPFGMVLPEDVVRNAAVISASMANGDEEDDQSIN